MAPKKSASDLSRVDFATAFNKLCQECDVLIPPIIVTRFHYNQDQQTSRSISKDFRKSALGGSVFSGIVAPPPTEIEDEEYSYSCGQPPSPPELGVVYEFPDQRENPMVVSCKNIYVEYSLVQAIFKSLRNFPTIAVLKLEDCCISQEIVELLASLMSEFPGKIIADLSLDGNEGIEKALPLLIRNETGLKYLSLRRCGFDDKGTELLAKELAYSESSDQKLEILNLNINLIGDEGARALAAALRTNRTLISLSLAGNRITSQGASSLADVLIKFPLTHEEVMSRREKNFRRILTRNASISKLLQEQKAKFPAKEPPKPKSGISNGGKKTKAVESTPKGKLSSNRDKRKGSLSRVSSGEKFQNKNKSGIEESPSGFSQESNSPEMLALLEQVEKELESDKHPYLAEVSSSDGKLWCDGCWRLSDLNLAYNALSISSLEKFTDVLAYQDKAFKPSNTGLQRLIIQPGNRFPEDDPKLKELQEALKARNRIRNTLPSDVRLGSGNRTSKSKR